ncbi:MAG: hypothetical protein HC771_13040 [Synechococcales cyanobacterium CRU_2_2]|nr:hypothetical protein [Synechococcales cyanobacterium CRU_2_2]
MDLSNKKHVAAIAGAACLSIWMVASVFHSIRSAGSEERAVTRQIQESSRKLDAALSEK